MSDEMREANQGTEPETIEHTEDHRLNQPVSPEVDSAQKKYIYLQYKIMEKMGFGAERSDLEWEGFGYSKKYRIIFERESQNRDFLKLLPVDLKSEDWNSPELLEIIKRMSEEIKRAVAQ